MKPRGVIKSRMAANVNVELKLYDTATLYDKDLVYYGAFDFYSDYPAVASNAAMFNPVFTSNAQVITPQGNIAKTTLANTTIVTKPQGIING